MVLDAITYLLEMNVSGATNGWVLGISGLGSSTILQDANVIGAALAPVAGIVSGTITRGRSDEFAAIEPGTATLIVDNADGRFSPDYAASPYYPNMTVMRQARVSARYNPLAAWTPIFYGYVESIEPTDNGPADSNVTIQCSDWLAKANYLPITYAGAQETDIGRVINVLVQAGTDGLPVVVYGSTANAETVRAKTYTDQKVLAVLQNVAANTLGTVYHQADGAIAYKTRYGRWQYPGGFGALHYLDQPGLNADPAVVPYTEMPYDLNLRTLYNRVTVNATGGAEGAQTATDATTQQRYGVRDYALDLDLLADKCSACLADALLDAYRTPAARIRGVTIDCDASPVGAGSWVDDALGMELGDTVRCVKREPGHVSIDRQMRIEGIRHAFDGESRTHTIGLTLSDRALAGPQPWMLSTSQLGASTPVVY